MRRLRLALEAPPPVKGGQPRGTEIPLGRRLLVVDQHRSSPDETRRTRLAKTTHHLKGGVVMNEWLQILGALLVLAAFVAAQLQVLRPQDYPYLILNLVGSTILAALAYGGKQW